MARCVWFIVVPFVFTLAAAPAGAQRVVAHVPFLPAEAGLNPIAIGAGGSAANQLGDELYFLSIRGVTQHLPSTSATWSWEIEPGGPTALPGGVAAEQSADPARRFYVAYLDALEVFEATTRARLGSIPLPLDAGRLALDETAGIAWVLSASSAELAAVDVGSLSLLDVVSLPDVPSELAVDATRGRVYVTSAAGNALYRVDANPPGLISTVPLDRQPTRLAVAAGLGKVYVVRESTADPAQALVTVVDEGTDTEIVSHPVAQAQRVELNETSGRAYVTGDNGGTLALFWLDGTATPDSLLTGPSLTGVEAVSGLEVDDAAGQVFIGEITDYVTARIHVFDEPSGMLDPPVETGATDAEVLVFHQPSDRLFIANPGLTTLTRFDPAGSATRIEAGVGIEVGGVNEVDPTEPKAYVMVQSHDELAVLRAPAGAPTRVAAAGLPYASAFLPGSDRLVILNALGSQHLTSFDGRSDSEIGQSSALPYSFSTGFAVNTATDKVYVSHIDPAFGFGEDQIQRYDPVADTLTDIAPTGVMCLLVVPLRIATNEAVNELYAAAFMSSMGVGLAVRDEEGGSWSCVAVPDSDIPLFIAVSEDLDRVYWPRPSFPPTIPPALVVLDPGVPDIVAEIPLTADVYAFALDETPGRERVYLGLADTGQVIVIDAVSNSIVGSPLDVGGVPVGLHLDAARDILYVANNTTEAVGLLSSASTASGSLTALSDLASFALKPVDAFTPLVGDDLLYHPDNRHGTLVLIDPAVAPDDMQIDGNALPGGVPGVTYATTLALSGGTSPHTWRLLTGSLPPGLALAPDGTISGTPTAEGTYSFMVSATDSATPAGVDVEDHQITVLGLRIVTRSLPDGVEGVAYDEGLLAVGGTPCVAPAEPYTWSVISGTLPPGLSLNSDGSLRGTPTGGDGCFRVEVEDCAGDTATADFCITVPSSGLPPRVAIIKLVKGAGPDDVDVLWEYPGAPDLAGFNVYRSADEGMSWPKLGAASTLPPTTTVTSHTDPVLGDGTPYWYRVRAVTDAGVEPGLISAISARGMHWDSSGGDKPRPYEDSNGSRCDRVFFSEPLRPLSAR